MKLSSSHGIGIKSEGQFTGLLPKGWVYNKLQNDFGKDFHVEIFDDEGKPTELFFYAQVKGTSKPKFSVKNILISFKVDELKYFHDKVVLPLFLFVIDNKNNKCYYLFLQEHIHKGLLQLLETQKYITVKVPQCNNIRNKKKLLEYVRAATNYMNDLRPGSIHAAIEKHRRDAQAVDPRIDQDYIVTGNTITVVNKPKQDIPISMSFGGKPDNIMKYFEALQKGLPISISGSDIKEISGLNFGPDMKIGTLVMEPTQFPGFEITVALEDENKKETFIIDKFQGHATRGPKQINIFTEIKESPLKLRLEIMIDSAGLPVKTTNANYSFDLRKWYNQNMIALPYFEIIYSFIENIVKCKWMIIRCDRLGNGLFNIKSSYSESGFFSNIFKQLSYLRKARQIIKKKGLTIFLKPEYQEEDYIFIDCIYDLLFNNKHIMSGNKYKISFKGDINTAKVVLAQSESTQGFLAQLPQFGSENGHFLA